MNSGHRSTRKFTDPRAINYIHPRHAPIFEGVGRRWRKPASSAQAILSANRSRPPEDSPSRPFDRARGVPGSVPKGVARHPLTWLLGEGGAEPLERLYVVAGGESLEPDRSCVSDAFERTGDGRVVDLASAGLAPPRHVRHLRLAGSLDQGHEVPLPDLGVV